MNAVTHDPRLNNWRKASHGLRRELAGFIPKNRLRELHLRRPARHFLVVARLALILALSSWGLWVATNPVAWVPLVLIQGLVFFDATVLLHEALHHLIWQGHSGRERRLGLAYGAFTGLSATQFSRWHLDHHAALGDPENDPKRHHLSPKRNSRLLKLAYFTPLLLPLYFRAASRETATYPPELRRRIRRERAAAVSIHLAVALLLWWTGGPGVALRVQVLPLFAGFPVWFGINRAGQHYWIDPGDPARWGTLVRGSPLWDTLFLWSNYHLEHHYFPAIPFYNLPKVHRLLQPFYEARGMRAVGYGELLWRWLILNSPPHARWS
ncbi:MAG: fatty acid desaturase [Acidobacteria bacterium]|nr:fatty acid desaturase [Acidobacteriota bacterium]